MGSNNSTQKTITSITNSIITNVMVTVSSSSSANTSQAQLVNIVNTSNSNLNIDLKALAKVSVTMLQSSAVNAQMQANIVDQLMSKLSSMKTDFPQLTSSSGTQYVENTIKNILSVQLGIDSLARLEMNVNQNQAVNVIGSDAISLTLKAQLQAQSLGELINTTSNQIATALTSNSTTSTDTSSTTTNFLTDLTNSILGGLNSIFSVSVMTWIAIVFIVTVVAYFGYKTVTDNPELIKNLTAKMS